jgi:hypothetical protein
MQKLNAVAVFAIAFVVTVFVVTFWLRDGTLSFRSSGAESPRASVPLVKGTLPATRQRLVLQGG